MHLLAAAPGAIVGASDPVDLGQTPADIVVISAADTELAALSEARAEMDNPPTLRLANLTHLSHPMSVDLHLDTCASRSRLVIARLLGGAGYWKYGFEQYAALLHAAGVPFAALPGDDKPDDEIRALSTIADADYDALWSYFVEGGPQNAVNLLTYAQAMLDAPERRVAVPAASPLLRAGPYWPCSGPTTLQDVRSHWHDGGPTVPVVFYRALVQGAGLHPINRLVRALLRAGLNPLPVFVTSLRDPVSSATLAHLFGATAPQVILNTTAFATGSAQQDDRQPYNPLAAPAANGAPVFQVVLASGTEEAWAEGTGGLSGRDIAMNVALPEVDGRILSRAISFKSEAYFDDDTQCPIATYRAHGDRIDFVAKLASNWAALRALKPADRKVALILANYPNRDGRLANGVGLDTPAATTCILGLLRDAGYGISDQPGNSTALMDRLMAGPTNWLADRADRQGGEILPLDAYLDHYSRLPLAVRDRVESRWGPPDRDPFLLALSNPDETSQTAGITGFKLSIHRFGNAVVALQPARGYNVDPVETYHSPDLVPPHNYLAFYIWLREHWKADAFVHIGKHGNLEWLPGKALALSAECFPEAILGPVVHIYPFIVNDPGEGTQAKRRAQAVILDHLTPPLSRAETYGPLRDLEALVDEYYEAAGVDPRRIAHLRREILSLSATSGLDQDAQFTGHADSDLAKLDAYLCELKEAQIRDGLHVFAQAPTGTLLRDLAIALARIPRADGRGRNASLLRAMAADLAMAFDPLDCDMAAPWNGPRPGILDLTRDPWRTTGDTVERLELLAQRLWDAAWDGGRGDGVSRAPSSVPHVGSATSLVLEELVAITRTISRCGPAEGHALLRALDGRAIPPGPSGAPTRGRLDTLPTGRNFFSVDSRAVPTPAAWALGWKSANLLLEKYLQDHGDWPRTMLITAWGTANMRTGGDDIAQCLALMGVKPTWDTANRRVTGYEVLPATVLARPRVDVTLRISGFFRDAFPQLIDLVDSAARAVMALDEPADINPAARRARLENDTTRVFGSKPGAYGAGLQAMIDEKLWGNKADLGDAYLTWGSYAYGGKNAGRKDRSAFEQRLKQTEAIVQNQDNREHDVLDSDDYYQFEGGAAAAVQTLQGQARPIYHNDHSRPERPVIRTLEDEIGRVVRSRVVNPKWIEGVKRHAYKGAFEIAATVDYMFAFAATTGAVKSHHFDLVHAAFLEDADTRQFIENNNAPALRDIAERLNDAIKHGFWTPKSNSARALIDRLRHPAPPR